MSHEVLNFSLPWAIPFGGFLLSLALIPLMFPLFWENHHKKIHCGWMIIFLSAFGIKEGITTSGQVLFDVIIHHYIPFMALISVLFIVGGGIHISMKGKASPFLNTLLLGSGALLTNVIGTTGASMLLIRPFIMLNRYRQQTTHLIIFFIFLVSNIGGILTPLGDPPLFIGFLNGVNFFWTTTHLIYPFLLVSGSVLLIFWVVDYYYFYHDSHIPDPLYTTVGAKFQISGHRNLFLLGITISVILLESTISEKFYVPFLGVSINFYALLRDVFLFGIAYASWKMTPSKIHEANHFNFAPLEEVAIVFLGIFITVVPVLSMLKLGAFGPLKDLVSFLNPQNIPNPNLYFWFTGFLSSLLDNAPTYLIFFNMAGGKASFLMNEGSMVLTAISTGAVFMGALTYIGNAPNFMVRAIALKAHIKMPSFLGYLLWSFGILLPIFYGFSWVWFH